MIKAIALDLDGTLLNSKKNISKRNIKILHKMYKKGVEIIIVTGRSFESVEIKVKEFTFPYDVICYNGAKIVKNGEVIYEKNLSEEIVKKLIDISKQEKAHLNLYQNEIWYVENKNSQEAINYRQSSCLIPEERDFTTFENFEMTKALFISDRETLKKIEKEISKTMGGTVYTAYSQNNFFEVLNKEVNKGLTLEKFLKLKNIDKKNCVAFGDAENDIEMLSLVGYGVAMENSKYEIKEKAKYITKSNDEDGVAVFLENLLVQIENEGVKNESGKQK